MSLQVWLPLTGNLNNQGIGNVSVTNGGASVSTSGKIGSCYSFDGSDDYISLVSSIINSTIVGGSQPFSITLWVYHADSTRGIIFGDYNLSGAINFNLELSTSHTIRFYWASDPDKSFSNSSVGASTWSHLAITYDGSLLKCYVNGSLVDSYSGTLTARTKTSTSPYYLGRDNRTGTTALNGRLNDFRVYDNCLSASEVYEISKGLVLHYPFNDLYSENTTNISSATTMGGWDNSGASTRTQNDTTISSPVGTNVYSIKVTTAGNCAITFGNTTSNVPSKTLTCSVYCYLSGSQDSNTVYIRSTKTDSNIGNLSYNGSTNPTTWPLNQWIRLTQTLTTNSEATTIYFCTYANNLNNYRAFTGWQIEEKDHATPYVKSSRSSNTEFDVSGYGSNSSISGSLTFTSGSPRYNYGAIFNGSTRLSRSSITSEIKAISVWVYTTSIPTDSQIIYQDESSSTGLGFCYKDSIKYFIASAGTKARPKWVISNYNINQWNHIVVNFDDTNPSCYVNNNSISSDGTEYWSSPSGISIGSRATSANYFNGRLSDLRLYSTTLSASDVSKLYHTPIEIANTGALLTQGEFIEE